MLPIELALSVFLGCFYLESSPALICFGKPSFLEMSKSQNVSEGSLTIGGVGVRYHFEKGNFESCSNLRRLELKAVANKFEPGTFHDRLFQNDSPSFLFLENNYLETFEAGVFSGMKVETLEVYNCNLKKIQPGAFEDAAIKTVELTYNHLSTIEKGVFTNNSMESIYLVRNQIQHIEHGAFLGMKNLKLLSLMINQLTDFEVDRVIGESQSLKKLILSDNSIKELKNGQFSSLPNLVVLELDGNQIDRIEDQTFEGLKNLEWLNLNNNNIMEIQPMLFNPVSNLAYLYLTDNTLTFIPLEVLESLPKLHQIAYLKNPWQCACLKIIHQTLTKKNVTQACNETPICNSDFSECVYDLEKSKTIVENYERDYNLKTCQRLFWESYF